MEALTIPVKLYIHFITSSFSKNKYFVATCDMSRSYPDHYVLLETRDIAIDLNRPEAFDIIALQVDQLRNQKAEITATASRQMAVVDDKIQQLLCIDSEPADINEIPY